MIGSDYYRDRVEKMKEDYETTVRPTTISMVPEMIKNLKRLAKRMGISRSELVRHCIYQALPIIERNQKVLEDPDSATIVIDGKEIFILGEA